MLPYTASRFIKSRELVNKLQSFISDEGWKETATALEIEFYTLVYNELSGQSSPKEEAATRLEQIRVAAETEKPELAQSINKWRERGLGEVETLENVVWDLLDQDDIVDIQTMPVQELTKRIRTADMKIKSLSLKDAEGKVATVILQIADDIGRIKQGVVEIEKLPFQHDLANMAGTSRETISRTLHNFAKRGLIELEGTKLRIPNYDKFREMFA
ncbi:MAG: Crp/Fnr family transcriptional regulator [Ignavibacteriaceae bacterium]|nr:Crp/Fnr family transcriptional regulator [Ignavibacteriaceae bacterium]